MDMHMSFPHQLGSSAETSSEYIFGSGIDIAHGIPQCMVNAAFSHGHRTGLPKGSDASDSSRVRVLGVSLLPVKSIPIKKHSRCGCWLLNQDVS